MSNTFLSSRFIKKSRKERRCDSCAFILFNSDFDDLRKHIPLTQEEEDTLNRMTKQNYKIQIGQPYQYDAFIFEGDFCTWSSDPIMLQIYHKYYHNRD